MSGPWGVGVGRAGQSLWSPPGDSEWWARAPSPGLGDKGHLWPGPHLGVPRSERRSVLGSELPLPPGSPSGDPDLTLPVSNRSVFNTSLAACIATPRNLMQFSSSECVTV